MIIIKKYKDKVYLSSGLIPYMCKQVIESDNSPVGHKVLCLGNDQLITILEKLLKKCCRSLQAIGRLLCYK